MSQPSLSEAIADVADGYRQQGYEVTLDPPSSLLPKEVQHYHPDFVASRGAERVAVEVKSRRALGADPELMRLAERFRRVPGWRLDVAVVEQGEKALPPSVLSADETQSRIAIADRIAAETQDYAAALLLLWTTIEAILHARLKHEEEDRPGSPRRLAKLAYSLGVVDDEDLPFIEWLASVRNDVVHGRKSPQVSPSAYQRARDLVTRLISAPSN